LRVKKLPEEFGSFLTLSKKLPEKISSLLTFLSDDDMYSVEEFNMRITQRQLRQIINEELNNLQEGEGDWDSAKSEAAGILVAALKKKYAKSLKAGGSGRGDRERRGSFSARDLETVVREKLNAIGHELADMAAEED
jgi:hypothetical protein